MGLSPPKQCCLNCDREDGLTAISIYDAAFFLLWLVWAIARIDNGKDSDTLYIWFIAIAAGVNFAFTVISLCKKHEGGLFKVYFWIRFICSIVAVALVILAANTFHTVFGFYNSAVVALIFGFSFYF